MDIPHFISIVSNSDEKDPNNDELSCFIILPLWCRLTLHISVNNPLDPAQYIGQTRQAARPAQCRHTTAPSWSFIYDTLLSFISYFVYFFITIWSIWIIQWCAEFKLTAFTVFTDPVRESLKFTPAPQLPQPWATTTVSFTHPPLITTYNSLPHLMPFQILSASQFLRLAHTHHVLLPGSISHLHSHIKCICLHEISSPSSIVTGTHQHKPAPLTNSDT